MAVLQSDAVEHLSCTGGEQLWKPCNLHLATCPLPLTTMTIRNTFRKLFGVSQDPFPLIKLRPELLKAIEEIAAREQTSVGAVVNNLVSFALSQHQSAEAGLQIWYQLTRREREITALIWLGLTNPQIAERLAISQNTVKTHIKNILAKFDVNSKESLREMLSTLDFSEWMGGGE